MSRAAVFFLALLCPIWPARAAAANPSPVYGSIHPQLRLSSVPVLLPMPLPQAIGPIRSVAVISAGRAGYYVGFSPVTHCGGALSCAFFHVAGFPGTTRIDRSYRDRPVRLPDGTRGFFRPEDCSGASCTEASLIFERYGAVYELDAKPARNSLRVIESAYGYLRILH